MKVLFKSHIEAATMNTQIYNLRVSSPYCENTGNFAWAAISPDAERGYLLNDNPLATAMNDWVVDAPTWGDNIQPCVLFYTTSGVPA
jgi:hypothetical protein